MEKLSFIFPLHVDDGDVLQDFSPFETPHDGDACGRSESHRRLGPAVQRDLGTFKNSRIVDCVGVEKERKIAHQVLAIVRYLGPRNRATPAAILFLRLGWAKSPTQMMQAKNRIGLWSKKEKDKKSVYNYHRLFSKTESTSTMASWSFSTTPRLYIQLRWRLLITEQNMYNSRQLTRWVNQSMDLDFGIGVYSGQTVRELEENLVRFGREACIPRYLMTSLYFKWWGNLDKKSLTRVLHSDGRFFNL